MNALLALRVGCSKNEDSIIKKNKQNVKDLIKIEESFDEVLGLFITEMIQSDVKLIYL